MDATVPATQLLSYDAAVAKYKNQRIQFNTQCQATPNTMTLTNDTNIMLYNRSPSDDTLHLGFMGDVTVKAWGFKIVMLSSATLPRAVVVDCNQSQNVAEIAIQK